jgi:hypothetical protein
MSRLFVSYSRADAGLVDTLVADAETLGHEVWVDRQLSGGSPWWAEVLRQIEECDVFVYALSPDAVTSRACSSEYRYAAALGKPILPVTVSSDLRDSLIPRAIAELQRVDYTTDDKGALSNLVRSINNLPPAPDLPEPMPLRPEVPATYLFDLQREIGTDEELTTAKQDQLLAQIEARVEEGHEPEAILTLLENLKARNDLLGRVERRIEELEAQLAQADATGPKRADPVAPASSPPEPVVNEAPPTPAPPPPQPSPQTQSSPPDSGSPQPITPATVNPAWWIAPIVFLWVGGLVAWLVNKDTDPKTARNMLITGIVTTLVLLALAA